MKKLPYKLKKKTQKTFIAFTFLIAISIPLVVWGIVNGDSFDIRNQAFENVSVSKDNPCVITFPNVNPYTIGVGSTVQIAVDAQLDEGITALNITNPNGEAIFSKEYESPQTVIAENFTFTATVAKGYELLGVISGNTGTSTGCVLSSPYDVKGIRAIESNEKPLFTSNPKDSKPNQSIQTGDTYEYILTAEDPEGDKINYSYSFTPRADWLKETIIEDGSSGKLTVKFRGTSNDPASYLANVFIHDGYTKNLASQSWVISVSPENNDNPEIKILKPNEATSVRKGADIQTSWSATDLNQIIKYELYISSNPSNEETWKTVDTNIAYDVTSYKISTLNITPGTYKIIAKAIDNQNPPASGMDISPEIIITGDSIKPDRDDNVVIDTPQITNTSPSSTDTVTTYRPTVRATLISSTDGEIKEESILFEIDGVDRTEDIKLNKISSSEYTLIYQTEQDFTSGLHEATISFEDTNLKDVTNSWRFTIQADEDTDSDTVNIFGIQITKRILIIIGAGLGILVIAIIAPIIIFSLWKEDKKREEVTPSESKILNTPSQVQTSMYNTPIQQPSPVKELVEKDVKEEDTWEEFKAVEPETPPQEIKEEPIPTEPEQEDLTKLYEEIKTQQQEVEPVIPTPPPPDPSQFNS